MELFEAVYSSLKLITVLNVLKRYTWI